MVSEVEEIIRGMINRIIFGIDVQVSNRRIVLAGDLHHDNQLSISVAG